MVRKFHVAGLAILAATSFAVATPPEIKAPAQVTGEVGKFVSVKVETTGAWVRYYALEAGLAVMPADKLKDPKEASVTGAKPGTYKLLAWTGDAEAGSAPAVIVVTLTAGPETPFPDPLPPVGVKLFFIVVRPDGMETADFKALMSNPAWKELVAAGHSFNPKTETEAWDTLRIVVGPGVKLPVVVTLKVVDGKSELARDAIPAPTTADGIRRLPDGVK